MRNPLSHLRPSLQVIAALVVLALLTVAQQHFLPHLHGAVVLAGAPLMIGQIRPVAKTYEMLRDLIRPDANQPESFPDVLYDTQSYAQAGSSTLTFFKSTAANLADQTLSNFASGQMPAFEYFEIHRVHLMIHSIPNVNATDIVTGAASDVQILHKTARGVLSFTLKSKPYGPWPIWYTGRPGGPVVGYATAGATAADTVITFGETESNGGFPVLGNIIIPPATQFSAQLNFNSTAISAATNITLALMGVHHRAVS